MYLIKDNILTKELDGKTKVNQNFNFGNLTSVDILNPLEIVLFYSDFNTVLVLDNELNLKHTIPFANNIKFASKAITDMIWVYNEDENKLQLYDYKSKTVSISSNVLTNFKPTAMETDFNTVQLIGVDKTLVFNRYLYLENTLIH